MRPTLSVAAALGVAIVAGGSAHATAVPPCQAHFLHEENAGTHFNATETEWKVCDALFKILPHSTSALSLEVVLGDGAASSSSSSSSSSSLASTVEEQLGAHVDEQQAIIVTLSPEETTVAAARKTSVYAVRLDGKPLDASPLELDPNKFYVAETQWCWPGDSGDASMCVGTTIGIVLIATMALLTGSAVANIVLAFRYGSLRRKSLEQETIPAARPRNTQAGTVAGPPSALSSSGSARRPQHTGAREDPARSNGGVVRFKAPEDRMFTRRSISGENSEDSWTNALRDEEDAVISQSAIEYPARDIDFGPCIYSFKQKRVYRAVLLNHYEVAIKLVVSRVNNPYNETPDKQLMTPIARQAAKDDINDLMREAVILSKLQHPNVVRTYGVVDWVTTPDGCQGFGVATEFCLFGSLKSVLNDPGFALPLALRLHLARGIAAGMQYLHAKHIMHRDLKASNILVDEHWNAKVIDFGNFRPSDKRRNVVTQASRRYRRPRGNTRGDDVRRAYSLRADHAAEAVERLLADQAHQAVEEFDSHNCRPHIVATPVKGKSTGGSPKARSAPGPQTHRTPPPLVSKSHGNAPASAMAASGNERGGDGEFEDMDENDPAFRLTTKMGTVRYLAPELFTEQSAYHYDSHTAMLTSDVYSFGIVLWEIFTRADPWHRERHSKFAILKRVVTERQRPNWDEPPYWVQTAKPDTPRKSRMNGMSAPPESPDADVLSSSVGSLDSTSTDNEHNREEGAFAGATDDAQASHVASGSGDRDSRRRHWLASQTPMFLAELRQLADACWHHDPNKRLPFVEVYSRLERLTAAFTDDVSGGRPSVTGSRRSSVTSAMPAVVLGTNPASSRARGRRRSVTAARRQGSLRSVLQSGGTHAAAASINHNLYRSGSPTIVIDVAAEHDGDSLDIAYGSGNDRIGPPRMRHHASFDADDDESDNQFKPSRHGAVARRAASRPRFQPAPPPPSTGGPVKAHDRVRALHPISGKECDGVVVGPNENGTYRVRLFQDMQDDNIAPDRTGSKRASIGPFYASQLPRSSIVKVVVSPQPPQLY